MVYSYVNLVVVCVDETFVLGCGLIDIVDKAMCRICLDNELESAEEVSVVIGVHGIICCKSVRVDIGEIASEIGCVCGTSNTSKRNNHVLENAREMHVDNLIGDIPNVTCDRDGNPKNILDGYMDEQNISMHLIQSTSTNKTHIP